MKSTDVLKFYKKLQFNETSIPEISAELIKEYNCIPDVFPDISEIIYADRILEVGCGAGWLSDSIAYYYGNEVEAIDFSPRAIKFAKLTAKVLGVSPNFVQADLFEYETEPADLVISNGVLHHTSDCMLGIEKCIDMTIPGGSIFLGLYHKYGRKPFLDHFSKLKSISDDEEYLFEEYRKLDNRFEDALQAKSWFLDQVMHPYETQHTLKEVMEVFERKNVRLKCTSINSYDQNIDLNMLYEKEKEYYEIGMKHLEEGRYFPGFFYILGEKLGG